MGNFRFDNRSKEKFAKDIKECTEIEEKILNLWLDLIKTETMHRPTYKPVSAGRNGEFLENKEVDSKPDFEVEGHGAIEVKFCKPFLKERFHLKEDQLKKYAAQDCTILIVNGWETDKPVFALIKKDQMQKIINECEITKWPGMGFKECYRVPTNFFIWRPLA